MDQPSAGEACPLVGLLVVDKPLGWSSMDVIRRLRRSNGRHLKAGHAGTLDPLATGVVVCCLGRAATRLVDRIMAMPKTYVAEIDLSAFTSTDDREGPRQEVAVTSAPDEHRVLDVLTHFLGEVVQKPPAYSAIHVGGRRAYQLARQGQSLDLPPRIVHIQGIDLQHYRWPMLQINVHCGRGTYIRSLARDIGMALGTGGHLASLRRSAVGPYNLALAVPGQSLDQPLQPQDLLPLPQT
jgi:tRNA pseudouridine55 synthase